MELVIVGWKPGLLTVSMIRYLRDDAGVPSLKEARRMVDDLISGSQIRIAKLTAADAERMKRDFEAFGATCEIA